MSEQCSNCKNTFIGIGWTYAEKLFCGKGCLVKQLQKEYVVKLELIK